MNERIFEALIQILQKQSNTIRKLTVLNFALGDSVRIVEERMGVPSEEFEKQFRERILAVEARGPEHDPQGIARELEETVDLMNQLEALQQRKPN